MKVNWSSSKKRRGFFITFWKKPFRKIRENTFKYWTF